MVKIYGFNNGGRPGWMEAVALAEDGTFCANHLCSAEGFMRHDLGMDGRSTWKHDTYNTLFPEGWETEFIPSDKIESHEGLQEAIKRGSSKQLSEDATTARVEITIEVPAK